MSLLLQPPPRPRRDRPFGGSVLPVASHRGTVCAGMRAGTGPGNPRPPDDRPPRGPQQPPPPDPKNPDAPPKGADR